MKKQFKAARELSDRLEFEAEKREKRRAEAEQKAEEERLEREAQNRRRTEALQRAAYKVIVHGTSIIGTVKRLYSNTSATDSLSVESGYKFTRWLIGGDQVKLDGCFRYLCLNLDNGKLGWARVTESRITFVGKGLYHKQSLKFQYRTWHVRLVALRPKAGDVNSNLKITLSIDSIASVDLTCWFYVSGIEVLSCNWTSDPYHLFTRVDLAKAMNDNEEGIRDRVLDLTIRQFKYKEALDGDEARVFFGDYGEQFFLQLARIGENEFLTYKKY